MNKNLKLKLAIVVNEILKYRNYDKKSIDRFIETISNIDDAIVEEKINTFYERHMAPYGLHYLQAMILNHYKEIETRKEIEKQIYGDHSKIKVKVNGKWKIKQL